jgi:hypothetical protein
MSINIVKGVEIGLGFEQTRRFGSAVHDVIEGRATSGRWIHRTNNAGGLTGRSRTASRSSSAARQADLDARRGPAVRRPRHRRGRRQGPLRAQSTSRRAGGGRRRRGDGAC